MESAKALLKELRLGAVRKEEAAVRLETIKEFSTVSARLENLIRAEIEDSLDIDNDLSTFHDLLSRTFDTRIPELTEDEIQLNSQSPVRALPSNIFLLFIRESMEVFVWKALIDQASEVGEGLKRRVIILVAFGSSLLPPVGLLNIDPDDVNCRRERQMLKRCV